MLNAGIYSKFLSQAINYGDVLSNCFTVSPVLFARIEREQGDAGTIPGGAYTRVMAISIALAGRSHKRTTTPLAQRFMYSVLPKLITAYRE